MTEVHLASIPGTVTMSQVKEKGEREKDGQEEEEEEEGGRDLLLAA